MKLLTPTQTPASLLWLKALKVMLYVHFIVLVFHSAAHFYHQVFADMMGTILIVVGYYLLPAFGLAKLSFTGKNRLLAVLIGISVAFSHGFLYHFVFDTPDYVCYFGVHITGLWFSLTAYGLAFTDFSIMALTLAILTAKGKGAL